ncbi:MIP/aquaporin family protein [Paractinoplanes atraurantiacus]|uniref:Aquaporin Z n=1 Tax=Paractinoplanes atraurantiacus TaxID=1036182 RepID=A0A285JGT2_9ACTN|nr:aquaporin [Actinoplanes atraurantiacus]SNY59482.1 aquaporin Z [Actinoplanes atraurantiacus]
MIFVRRDIIRPTAQDARAAVAEFLLTAAFMASVFSLVRWGIGTMAPGASAAELRVRVAAVSASVGVLIVGFAVSRPGRFSGAHMNPAITLGLFAAGAVPARRVLPYLAAQVSGSIVAAMLARLLWGPSVGEEPVKWAVVQPGNGWSGWAVAAAEAATLAAIVAVMCAVKNRRPRWPLAWIVGALFGLQGAILGTLSGGSANPARQLGPALFSGDVHLLIVYLVAPVAGAMLAGHIATGHRLRHPSRIEDFGPAAPGPAARAQAEAVDQAEVVPVVAGLGGVHRRSQEVERSCGSARRSPW